MGSDGGNEICFWGGFFFGMFLGCVIAFYLSDARWRQFCVDSGYASYSTKTGKVEFKSAD